MDADDLFLATLDDLRARSQPGTSEYDVIHVAALLRKLLLDDTRLVDQANRSRRLQIRFRTNVRAPRPGAVFWSVQDGLDPDTAAPINNDIRDLTRDQLLAVPVIAAGGLHLTVLDVVRYLAHIAGAVHIGTPTTDKEKALAALGASVQIGGYSPEVRSLLAIARVVEKGLIPLAVAIRGERALRSSSAADGQESA